MPKFDSKILQDTYERLQTGQRDEKTAKKRRRTFLFIMADAVIIIIIFLFLYKTTPDDVYKTVSLNYEDVQYRFSISDKQKENKLFFSLSMISNSDSKKIIKFNKKIGEIELSCKDKNFWKSPISKGTTRITLNPAETRTFVVTLDKSDLNDYAFNNPKSIVYLKKSLINFKDKELQLIANLKINTDKKISTILKFNFEVN